MKKQIAALIKVKTIVTLLVTIVFCYLSARQYIPVEEFLKILTIVFVFYFSRQTQKGDDY